MSTKTTSTGPSGILSVTLTPNNIQSRLCRDPTTFTSLACIPRTDAGAGAGTQASGPNMMFDAPAMLFCGPDDEVNLKADEEARAKASEQDKAGDPSLTTSRSSLDKDRQSQPIISKYWMEDSACVNCYECKTNFSTTNRRHHCRACGQIFCSKCCPRVSLQQLGLEGNTFLMERLGLRNAGGDSGSVSTKLCTYCRSHLLDYIPGKDKPSAVPNDTDDDLKVVGKKCPAGVVGVMLDPLEKPDMRALEEEWALHDNVITERATERLREVVAQLVAAQGLPCEWVAPVVRLASAAARDVLPVTGDSRDIRKYVRVKIVPGGSVENSNYFSAFSFGRKNVMLKGMQSQFVEPRILLLNFPIDYLREPRLVSIDDVMSQERAHLRILVSKIAAIKPDVIFVGKMVSYIAAEYFLQERITVFSNVKPSVMEALARYTGGAIIKSAATLSTLAAMEQQRSDEFLGRCHTLSSVDYKISNDVIKTIFFLEGSPRLGGTIILRGSLPPVLEEVKRVVRFATFAAHSLSLEHAFIAEELLHKVESPSAKCDEEGACRICTKRPSLESMSSPAILSDDSGDSSTSDITNISNTNSSSSLIKMSKGNERDQEQQPILMYEICGKMPSRQYPVVSVSLTHESKVPNVIIKSPRKVVLSLSDFSLQNLNIPGYISLRRRRERDWMIEPFLIQDSRTGGGGGGGGGANNGLEQERVTHVIWREFDIAHSARDFQYILVLHALARRDEAKTQCIPYEILVFEFYGEKERSLGQFLEDCCFNTDKPCRAEACKEPMHLHERSFLHNDGRVDITIDDAIVDSDAMSFLHDIGVPSNVFMHPTPSSPTFHWRYCTLCHKASCAVPLSKESWNLSFGKFLEILFYSAASSFLDFCPHSAGNHVICFLRGSVLVRFTYTPLHMFTLVTPSLVKTYSPQAAAAPKEKFLIDLRDKVRKTVNDIFDDIVAALHIVKQYSDTLFRITSDDMEADRHPLAMEIEAFQDLFVENLKANRELIDTEREAFLKRLDSWDKCDILEFGNIKWDLHFAYKRWIRALQGLLEPPKKHASKKQPKDVIPSKSPAMLGQKHPQDQDASASPTPPPPTQPQQQHHLQTSNSIDIPAAGDAVQRGSSVQTKAEIAEPAMMASSDDTKTSRFPWVVKFASHFTKTASSVASVTEAAATVPRSIESLSYSMRDVSMASSLASTRPKTMAFPSELPSLSSSSVITANGPATTNATSAIASTTTSGGGTATKGTSDTSPSRKSTPLSVPKHSMSSMPVMISASPVRISMCSSPASAMSFDKNRVLLPSETSPVNESSSNAPAIPVPVTVPSATLNAPVINSSVSTNSVNLSALNTNNNPNSVPVSHIVGPNGVFPALDLSSFMKTLTVANPSNAAMLLASTGIVEDSDMEISAAYNDSSSSSSSISASAAATTTTNNNGSSSSIARSGLSQRVASFPAPPAITGKYPHPVQDNGEIYFETENESGLHIVVYKSEFSTIVAYALQNSKEMVMLNKLRYGTMDNKFTPEPAAEITKPLNVPSNPLEKSNMILKSTLGSPFPPSQAAARSSLILTNSAMPPPSRFRTEEVQTEKDINQSMANEDDSYQDYDDYNGSESDIFDELSTEEDEEDEYDEEVEEDDIVVTEEEDERPITNSPTLGPKTQNSSPHPLSTSPTQQSQLLQPQQKPQQPQPQQPQQQQQQQQQTVSGEILREQLLKDLRSDDESEVKYSFVNHEKCKISGIIYFAKQFYSLRRLCWSGEKDDTHFIRSLSNCRGWNVSGGKSKSHFDKTWDDRFVLKEIPNIELDGFKDFATKYFNYLAEAFTNSISTQLAKIFGIYTVNINTPDLSKKYTFLVMENLHYEFPPKKVFDLKGALRNRFVSDPSSVQLDGNLLRLRHRMPLCVKEGSKQALWAASTNDTKLLASCAKMDYSMLVGLDFEKKCVMAGIIDYIRTYTLGKRFETVSKTIMHNTKPTILPPEDYRSRFLSAMTDYFVFVPDHYTGTPLLPSDKVKNTPSKNDNCSADL